MKELIEKLKALGFGTDSEINGGDVVDLINAHWPLIEVPIKTVVVAEGGLVRCVLASDAHLDVTVFDKDDYPTESAQEQFLQSEGMDLRVLDDLEAVW